MSLAFIRQFCLKWSLLEGMFKKKQNLLKKIIIKNTARINNFMLFKTLKFLINTNDNNNNNQ